MRRFTSSVLAGVLFLAVAAPALASVPTTPARACCMRAAHHACSHVALRPQSGSTVTSSCPCDSCDRTLAVPAARSQQAGLALGFAPQFTYASEFYGWPALGTVAKVQSQRAPPRFSIQRVKYLGGRVSATVHRWTAAVWPL